MDRRESFDPLIAVVERNNFYRSSYRRLLFVLTVSVVINLTLSSLYWYVATHPVLPVYFATTINNRILPIYPLTEPNRSDTQVLSWAENAAMGAFTYNYANYRREFQSASDFFSPWGWSQFLEAIKDSNNLDAVIAKKLVVSASLVEGMKSKILRSGKMKGHYAWQMSIPLLVTYQSTETYTQQETTVTLLVVRLSNLNSPSGLGIEQFVVAPGVSHS